MSDNDVVIKVENLGKQYIIGHQNNRERYYSLRDTIAQTCKNLIRTTTDILTGKPVIQGDTTEEVWALKDVTFEVKRGQSLGIIGRNGAGKSTLLKVLSRITEPTTGRVSIKGRVASLLEVGTGFHPELSGRENIFLNGAILGMNRRAIKSKFDEIVAFAEIEKYIDTPVKRYSSGMYVRLAFSVAAHTEPDILVVDEVLAVGDTIFQKKCIDKMMEVTKQDRTILFVSHNFSAIRAFCNSALLLEQGMITFSGKVEDSISKYIETGCLEGKEISLLQADRNMYARDLVFERIAFLEKPIPFGKAIEFTIRLKSNAPKKFFSELEFGIAIQDKNQNILIHAGNKYINRKLDHFDDGAEYYFSIENNLRPGNYYLTLFLRSGEVIQDWLTNIITFDIADGNPYGYADTKQIQGMIFPRFEICAK